jgi:hypothetical protein
MFIEDSARRVPIGGCLQLYDFVEVDRPYEKLGRMESSQALAGKPAEFSVINLG